MWKFKPMQTIKIYYIWKWRENEEGRDGIVPWLSLRHTASKYTPPPYLIMFSVCSHLQLTTLDWTSCYLSHEDGRRNVRTCSEMTFPYQGTTAGDQQKGTRRWEGVKENLWKNLVRCHKSYLDFFKLGGKAAGEAALLLGHCFPAVVL